MMLKLIVIDIYFYFYFYFLLVINVLFLRKMYNVFFKIGNVVIIILIFKVINFIFLISQEKDLVVRDNFDLYFNRVVVSLLYVYVYLCVIFFVIIYVLVVVL